MNNTVEYKGEINMSFVHKILIYNKMIFCLYPALRAPKRGTTTNECRKLCQAIMLTFVDNIEITVGNVKDNTESLRIVKTVPTARFNY